MIYYSVPADFKTETIDKYIQLASKYPESQVLETYGQITIGNFIGSGRAYDLIPQVDLNTLKKYIKYSANHKIGFNYTLNTTCMGNREFTKEGIARIIEFLDVLQDAGVTSITVTLPSIIELIKLRKYEFEIKASTVCQITNANKAMAYKKLGVDKIVIDESINRDFDTLKRIRNVFGEKVEVIVNVICHKNCIYEMFHHNQTSHDSGEFQSKPSVTYYSHRCMMKRSEDVSNLLKLAWIRPEDIKYYVNIGINYFKLQGRQAVLKGDPVKTVESYFAQHFDGNLVELLDMFAPTNSFMVYLDNKKLNDFIKPFYENPSFCKNDCSSCRYCENYIKKCVEYEKVKEVFDLAQEFYRNYDEFINTVVDIKKPNYSAKEFNSISKLVSDDELGAEFDYNV